MDTITSKSDQSAKRSASKIVLVSISDARTMDNYALFEGSVLHELSKRKNIEVVALVAAKAEAEISYVSPNLHVEYVTHNSKLSKVQRVIQFLYSYLLFTSTTNMVAGRGARSDAPRTILQDISYPFKWFYAKTFGRMPFMRNSFAPFVYTLAFTRRPYKKIFEQYDFDLVFLPNMCRWPADIELLAEAKRRNIRSVGIPRNWDHMSKFFIPFKLDTLCVWSKDVKQEAIKYQDYNESNVIVTGSPQVDFMVAKSSQLSRDEFLDALQFPQHAKVILFASQGPYSIDSPDYVDMLLHAHEEGKFTESAYFIVRPYPGIEFDLKKLKKFENHPRIFFDALKHQDAKSSFIHYVNVLKHSDVVVTTYSSVLADTSIFDTPCVVTSFDGYKGVRTPHQTIRRYETCTHISSMKPLQSTWFAKTHNELIEAVQTYLKNPSLHQEGRHLLMEHVFGYDDGQNSKRVLEVILKNLE